MNKDLTKDIDIKNLKTAKRYAQALFKSADNNEYGEILNDLEQIQQIIFENKDFLTFFLHPVVSLKDKKIIINEALEGKINQKTLNFLQTLLDENRFNIFQIILTIFKKEIEELNNKQQVVVVSAVELDEETKEKLRNKLNEKLKKDTVLNYTLDKDIIGGLVIKTEDKVIDLSLKSKFETLKKQSINLI